MIHIKNQEHIYRQCRRFDIVMPMYNLLEFNGNYSMTSGSLGNYYMGWSEWWEWKCS